MSRQRRHLAVAALAVIVAATSLVALAVASGSPHPDNRSPAARGARALRTAGYRSVALTCTTGKVRSRCQWSAVRARRRCRGALTVTSMPVHGRVVTLGRALCRRVVAANPAKSSMMRFGFNAFTDAQSVKLQARTGATVRRLNISWTQVQPLPGQWNWTAYDKQYHEVLDGGLTPLIMVFAAPCWARPRTSCDPLTSGPPDPGFDKDWMDFVRRVAVRYPQAIAMEIWSEPNLDPYFAPRADPVRYTALLKEAYGQIKAVSPAMPVISGGLAASGEPGRGPVGDGDQPFLAEMYAAGAASVMDGIGTHPYPYSVGAAGKLIWDPAAMAITLQRLRAVRDGVGARQTIWITEMGESTTTQPGFPPAVSPTKQAADLQTMLQTAIAAPDVPVVIIHTLQDAPANLPEDGIAAVVAPLTGINVSYNRINSGFGIFGADKSPKPAACAVSRQLGGPLTC